MEAIRTYSIEPGFTQPVDRFSFAIKKDEWDNLSTGLNSVESVTGKNGDIGLTVFFRTEGDLRVRLVEPNSPAGTAGIHRGWRITKINGNTNITTANASFIADNIYNSSNVNISFRKSDGDTEDISLSQAHYTTTPVYLDTVYNVSNKKIGYLVFNSFLGNINQLYGDFQRVFNRFEGEGVEDLVIDLRYNGGGYVSVQEKLANYLVNTTANGNIMMKQVYNSNNSASNETTNFRKLGSLNLSRLYFIVGRATASASELLINNLKPYMNVKLIGGTTYGKPVGFFPIAVGDWYIFPVSFRTLNKNGEGNYFNGMTVDKTVADGLDKEWGDLSESSLASAVNNITSGSFRVPGELTYTEPATVAMGNGLLEAPLLKLTVGSTPK
jgi:C-terminal processing protease CtpA/Prc